MDKSIPKRKVLYDEIISYQNEFEENNAKDQINLADKNSYTHKKSTEPLIELTDRNIYKDLNEEDYNEYTDVDAPPLNTSSEDFIDFTNTGEECNSDFLFYDQDDEVGYEMAYKER